jgi:hypothetical protein
VSASRVARKLVGGRAGGGVESRRAGAIATGPGPKSVAIVDGLAVGQPGDDGGPGVGLARLGRNLGAIAPRGIAAVAVLSLHLRYYCAGKWREKMVGVGEGLGKFRN